MDKQQNESLTHEKSLVDSKISEKLDIPIGTNSSNIKLRTKNLLKHINKIQNQIDEVTLENKSIEESRLKLALNLRRF